MKDSLSKLLLPAIRAVLCGLVFNLGFITFLAIAALLSPDRMAGFVPPTNPASPLARLNFDPRFNDWYTAAKLESAAVAHQFLPGYAIQFAILVLLSACAVMAGTAGSRLALKQFKWSRPAVVSFRASPPRPQLNWLLPAAFVTGFLWCGVLHELLRAAEISQVELLPQASNGITFGILLGAGLSLAQVLQRRRFPVGSGTNCSTCGYDLAGLPNPTCPECATPAITTLPELPAPSREITIAWTIGGLLLLLGFGIIILRPGSAMFHQAMMAASPITPVAFAPGQAVRITTKDGSWILHCAGTPTPDDRDVPVLREVTCTLRRSGNSSPEATTRITAELPNIYGTETIVPLRFGNGGLRIDLMPWSQDPKYLYVTVLGAATIEPVEAP